MRTDSDLTKIVNQSGFPLQLAIDRLVTRNSEALGWSVLYREHGWRASSGEEGFADLVLENRWKTSVLVLECKRVRDSDWIFLEEAGQPNNTRRARVWINSAEGGVRQRRYFDLQALPESPVSMYCVVAGQDPKSRPLLERIAADVTAATEAVAFEEYPYVTDRAISLRMYASVIVTTARLSMTAIESATVSLDSGETQVMAHRDVPWVRFRKQLSPEFAVEPSGAEDSFASLADAREKMVFVVNAQSLEAFLQRWDVVNNSLNGLFRGA